MAVSTGPTHGLMAETMAPPYAHTVELRNYPHCPTVRSGVHLHKGTATLSGTLTHANLAAVTK
ncbi:unnamed protein product [Prunus armeniaca]|nr:unnamed protein product [Prunus armeniaca]